MTLKVTSKKLPHFLFPPSNNSPQKIKLIRKLKKIKFNIQIIFISIFAKKENNPE